MDYWNNFQDRVLRGASNTKDRMINDTISSFEKYMHQSPTAHELPISMVNQFPDLNVLSKELVVINDVSKNDKKSLDEKYLLTRRDLNVDIGCYVRFDNQWFIVAFEEHKSVKTYRKFVIRKCNYEVKYKLKGVVYSIPIAIHNMTLYATGVHDQIYTSIQNAKRDIWIGMNEITKNIDEDTRLMLDRNTVFEVTHVNAFEYPGLIKLLLTQDAVINEDDKDNNIAYNPESDVDKPIIKDVIQGNEFITLGSKNNYNITNADKIEWVLKEECNYMTLVSNNNGTCSLQSKPLAQYVGAKVELIARYKSSKVTVDNIIVTIRG